MTEPRQPRGRPEKVRQRSETFTSGKRRGLLLLAATGGAGEPVPAPPARAAVDASKSGAFDFLARGERRDVRQMGENFVQGATNRGRIQLTGDATATATISVVWGKSAVVVRLPVSLAKMRKKDRENPFSFKFEESSPSGTERVGTGGDSFRVDAVSLPPAEVSPRRRAWTTTVCE